MIEPTACHTFSTAAINAAIGTTGMSLHDPSRQLPSTLSVLTAGLPPLPQPQSYSVPAFDHDVVIVQLRGSIILEGRLVHRFQGHSHPGFCSILPRGEPSKWAHQGGVDAICIQLPTTIVAETALHAFDCDPAHVSLRPMSLQPDALLYGIGQALLAELQRESDPSSLLVLDTLRQTLLVHVLRSYTERGSLPTARSGQLSQALIRRVTEFVEAHLNHDLSLAELAALVHLSPYHFARAFKHATGQSVHQYVIARRLEAGRHLIETTTLTISEVAEQVGFADHSHFARAFKRSYGVSPSSVARGRKNLHTQRTNLPAETT